MIISPSLTVRDQSNREPSLRLNCLTMLAGTVVLRDVVLVAAFVRVVPSPILLPSLR
jgi:hypothetical protein